MKLNYKEGHQTQQLVCDKNGKSSNTDFPKKQPGGIPYKKVSRESVMDVQHVLMLVMTTQ